MSKNMIERFLNEEQIPLTEMMDYGMDKVLDEWDDKEKENRMEYHKLQMAKLVLNECMKVIKE